MDDPQPAPNAAAAPADTPPRRRRVRHIARNAALVVLGLLFTIWLVLFVTKGRFLKHPFETIVGRLTHREVKVAGDFQLYFAPLQIKFAAQGLSIANPAWASRPYLFRADALDSRIAPLSLLFGRRRFYWLDLTNGAVDLEWLPDHSGNTWTFSAKKGGKPLQFPVIDRASVTGTRVRYLDPRLRLLADLAVDPIRSADARIGDAVGVTGQGRLRATPFTVAARLLSPNQTVARGANRLELTAHAGANVIDVTGTLPSLAAIEGVPLQTRARGRDLSQLLGIIGVAIPRTRTYRLKAQLVQQGRDYRFTHLSGTFGDSDVAGALTVTNGDRLYLTSTLATRQLDIVDAAPFIGYNPDIVAAKGAAAAAAATGAAPERLLPDAALPVATMRRFDADLKWTIRTVRSRRVPISDVDVTLALKDGRLALSPLSFAMARGNVAADVVFDTRQRPAADSYDIRLAPTPLGKLLAGWGVAEAGTTGVVKGRIQLAGRGDSVHDSLASARGRMAFVLPSGSMWARNAQLSELDIGVFVQKMFQRELKEPVRINCGLVGFTVRDGVAAADPILIDTTKNVVTGRGGFSFRNETVDLAIRADGKKFSLFSGQSPVSIGGTFAHPSLNVISPQLLARAGAGLGLAVVATPLAGILAFVDVGDAKAAACGPVLAGADARAQRTTKGKPREDVGNGTPAKSGDGGETKAQRKKFLGIF
ncbi:MULTISPECIES: AsmA family protein [unclassified Sphingomonas]|uniref:AsmA family protein n=1 Tax=unclassified Sphingomonas TaxID=196159 RepID=UPI000E10E5B0|nr:MULTISPECIES: AsmA family protein [unclassified Sphingomonas]AXJ95378.1 AsmA family protein [Sphingomonas sp. FARSPH]